MKDSDLGQGWARLLHQTIRWLVRNDRKEAALAVLWAALEVWPPGTLPDPLEGLWRDLSAQLADRAKRPVSVEEMDAAVAERFSVDRDGDE